VELAKEYGGEKSPGFVNAVLDRIWKMVEPECDSVVDGDGS
jgi:transcription termination factor NusB